MPKEIPSTLPEIFQEILVKELLNKFPKNLLEFSEKKNAEKLKKSKSCWTNSRSLFSLVQFSLEMKILNELLKEFYFFLFNSPNVALCSLQKRGSCWHILKIIFKSKSSSKYFKGQGNNLENVDENIVERIQLSIQETIIMIF